MINHCERRTYRTMLMMIAQLLILITNLLFFTAQCSDAYTPPTRSHRHRHHYRWSTSSRLLSSTTTTSVDGTTTTSTATPTSSSESIEEDENNIKTRDLLSLDYIRSTLIRQEETIIFALIERSQFRQNPICYEPGGVPGLGVPPGSRSDGLEESEEEFSFLDFMFTGTVNMFYFILLCPSLFLFAFSSTIPIYLCAQIDICKNTTTNYKNPLLHTGSTSQHRATIRIARRTCLLPLPFTQTYQLPL